MLPKWIIKGIQFAVRFTAVFGYICVARNHYGTISVVGSAFVNREVSLKATPLFSWGCDVEWKYRMEGGTHFQTMSGAHVNRYLEDGSFFLKWKASVEYNRSEFYAGCSTNARIKTRLISLNVKEIVGQCGALVILPPIVRGADLKLGYFPSDYALRHQLSKGRTWKKNDTELREGSYVEEIVSEYLYILTIFNFEKRHEGTYILYCNLGFSTDSVQLHIPEPPSYPILGPKSADFNTTECIYVYEDSDIFCQTENGTEPVQVALLLGQDSLALAESEQNNGSYLFSNVHQQIDGLSRRNVTCQVSNAAIETPYEVHGILCNVEKGSQPVLTVPEFLDGESSTTICEVRNAIPAPVIDIHVGNVLLSDVLQTDIFNGYSHTFTSTAKVTTTNKLWNGKAMCCTKKSFDDFRIADYSICKNINIKYPPSNISMSVKTIQQKYNDSDSCFINLSCETNASNPPCAIDWSSNRDDLRYIDICNGTIGEHGSYRFVSNAIYIVANGMAGGTITCSTRCDHFSSHLTQNYTVSFSGDPTLYLNTTSPVDVPPDTTVVVKCTVLDECNANGQYTLWWEDGESTIIKTCSKTDECLLTLNHADDGERRFSCKKINAKKVSLKVLSSLTKGNHSHEKDNQTLFSTFQFPVNNVLIGAAVFCGLCIFFAIGRCIFLKRRKDNTVNTIEIVEHHSDTTSGNGVLHVETGGVQYAVVQRQASTQRIETQQPRDDDGLAYAELDITFLQEANAGVPARRTNTPTEYADIEFPSTQ